MIKHWVKETLHELEIQTSGKRLLVSWCWWSWLWRRGSTELVPVVCRRDNRTTGAGISAQIRDPLNLKIRSLSGKLCALVQVFIVRVGWGGMRLFQQMFQIHTGFSCWDRKEMLLPMWKNSLEMTFTGEWSRQETQRKQKGKSSSSFILHSGFCALLAEPNPDQSGKHSSLDWELYINRSPAE